jgi:AraC-like DNA-binding protein
MPSVGALRDVANVARSESVVVMLCDADLRFQARVLDAVRGRGRIRTVASLTMLLDALSGEPADVVIVPPRDTSGRDSVPFVREIIRQYPQTAIIAYVRPRLEDSAEIRNLAMAGVHQYVFAGDDNGLALFSALESARRECAAEMVMQRLASVLPERIHPIAETCLLRPAEIRCVDDLVAASRLHRKTLYNQCRRAGLSGPAELLGWCRLAVAAFILSHSGKTIEVVSDELEFASPTALRNMMKRYTGRRANEVRVAGGLECLATALEARLQIRRVALHVV